MHEDSSYCFRPISPTFRAFRQAAITWLAMAVLPAAAAAGAERLVLTTVDAVTKQPVACRIHLRTATGRPRIEKGYPAWGGHFVFPGKVTLELPPGNYQFELERGPEYNFQAGQFTIHSFSDDAKTVEIQRASDLAAEGWYSGDLDIRRPPGEMKLLMDAEDLHVAQVMSRWDGAAVWKSGPDKPVLSFDGNRLCDLRAEGRVSAGGPLAWFNLASPLDLGAQSEGEYPPPPVYLAKARAAGAWIDVAAANHWDLPMLVALGCVDSVRVADERLVRSGSLVDSPKGSAAGRPSSGSALGGLRGYAQWLQAVYYHLLNCGLRIPPSAASGAGRTANPAGYNRVYVATRLPLTPPTWWEAYRSGHVMITNGPLLRPLVEGKLPGHVFSVAEGPVDLEIALNLTVVKPHGAVGAVPYLEIVQDGQVARSVRLDEYAKTGKLPPVRFERSGWFLVRAVADYPNNYRFGMTAPYYVEIAGRPRISRTSAQFFLDWVYERARQLKLSDPARQREVLDYHRRARDYWQDLVNRANAE